MGLGWSKRRDELRNPQPHHHQYPQPPPPPPPPPLPPQPPFFHSSASSLPPPTASSSAPISAFSPPPPPPAHPPPPPQPPAYVFPAGSTYSSASSFPINQAPPPYPSAAPYPAPSPPAGWAYRSYGQYAPGGYANTSRVLPGRSNYPYYGPGQGAAWWPPLPHPASSSSSLMAPHQPPPPYVEHQQAVTIKNNVNLHKDTIRLERDEQNPDHYLVSFTFDSLVDGSITIFYFAKEGENCTFLPAYPDICMPVRVPFQKGLGQKFCQPSGSGIDLGFFELDDLSKPSQGEIFPLVVSAEALPEPMHSGDKLSQPLAASGAQITQAIVEKKDDGQFQVKVIKQILWIGCERYELKEIFGLANSAKTEGDDDDLGKECVICMTEPKDTAVLPCRHMCMCSGCAKALRLQTNKCPICRQPVEELMEIKVNNNSTMATDV